MVRSWFSFSLDYNEFRTYRLTFATGASLLFSYRYFMMYRNSGNNCLKTTDFCHPATNLALRKIKDGAQCLKLYFHFMKSPSIFVHVSSIELYDNKHSINKIPYTSMYNPYQENIVFFARLLSIKCSPEKCIPER